jgi:predicted esterase
MQIHHLEVQKTARIFTLGSLTEKTENIWLVLHGYGMLPEYFIQKFNQLDTEKNYIIAPEGLSKFYQNGLIGRIGASWMTSEDRENEIKDYINYLETIFQTMIQAHLSNKKLICFGFSQGVSTLFRWANEKLPPIHQIISWAGSIPKEVLDNYQLDSIPLKIYYGNEDPLIPLENVHQLLNFMREKNIPFQSFEYKGGHAVNSETIKTIIDL